MIDASLQPFNTLIVCPFCEDGLPSECSRCSGSGQIYLDDLTDDELDELANHQSPQASPEPEMPRLEDTMSQ